MKKTLVTIMACAVAAVLVMGLAAGDADAAQYKGSAACKMCHKGMHSAIVEGYTKTAHPKAMQKADAADAIVGDFATNTAFKKDQVAFVLGKGKKEQAYLDANHQVLPAVWDVKAKTWRPTQAVDGSTQCIGCHMTGYDAAAKTCVEVGVGCEACHGPGGDHVAKPGKDNAPVLKGMPANKQAMVCGQCHSLGKDPSGKYAFPIGFRPGDDLAAHFVDAKPTAPGRNQQYSDLMQSKHGQMGFSCTVCHDPHNVAGQADQLKKPVNDLCLGCHGSKIKDMATHKPNAPADATCATCHMPGGRHTFKKPGG